MPNFIKNLATQFLFTALRGLAATVVVALGAALTAFQTVQPTDTSQLSTTAWAAIVAGVAAVVHALISGVQRAMQINAAPAGAKTAVAKAKIS